MKAGSETQDGSSVQCMCDLICLTVKRCWKLGLPGEVVLTIAVPSGDVEMMEGEPERRWMVPVYGG